MKIEATFVWVHKTLLSSLLRISRFNMLNSDWLGPVLPSLLHISNGSDAHMSLGMMGCAMLWVRSITIRTGAVVRSCMHCPTAMRSWIVGLMLVNSIVMHRTVVCRIPVAPGSSTVAGGYRGGSGCWII